MKRQEVELVYAQKVRLMMMLSSPKLVLMLQSVLGKNAVGWPQGCVLMFADPEDTSPGMLGEFLAQNQTLIPALVRSIA